MHFIILQAFFPSDKCLHFPKKQKKNKNQNKTKQRFTFPKNVIKITDHLLVWSAQVRQVYVVANAPQLKPVIYFLNTEPRFCSPTLGIHLLLSRVVSNSHTQIINLLRFINNIVAYFFLPSESLWPIALMLLSWFRSLSSGPRKRSRKESCLSVTGVPLRDAQFHSIKKK